MDIGCHGNDNRAEERGLSHLRWRLPQVGSHDLRIEGSIFVGIVDHCFSLSCSTLQTNGTRFGLSRWNLFERMLSVHLEF